MNLQERTIEDGVTITATWRSAPPRGADPHIDPAGTWYDVRLAMGARKLATPFYMGPAHASPPDAALVLTGLLDDAAGYENEPGLDAWAREYGTDDARQTRREYLEVQRQTLKLRAFLADRYDAYLWETAR